MKDVRTMLNDFVGGLGKLGETNEAHVQAFMNLLGTNYAEGALSVKTKELISVAIGAYNRCEYCIVYHVYKAYEAGATREEIIEAAMIAVAFGGGPSMAYSVTTLMDAVNEFIGFAFLFIKIAGDRTQAAKNGVFWKAAVNDQLSILFIHLSHPFHEWFHYIKKIMV